MKNLFGVMAVGCLLTMLLVGRADAQEPGSAIRASIPFDFIVRGRTLPAGQYEITRINDEPMGLMIRNVDHRRDQAMFDTEPVEVHRLPRKNVLVFNRYGDSYFLEEVVTAGEQTGAELFPTHAERTLRREMAKNQLEPETITVAMN